MLTSAFLCQPSFGAATQHDQVLVYFGTYTGAKSKGIYYARLDTASGRLSQPELAAEISSPSFVAIDPKGNFLYAVNEISSFGGKRSGAATAFAINAEDGKLRLLNQQSSGGDGPCHLIVDHTGKNVLIANYGGGSCAVLPVQGDGSLGAATAFIQHQGSSANKQRQEGPHAHGIYLDAGNRFAFVPDLGLDKVMIYKFDSASGKLTSNDPAFASIAPGSGPRHFAFSPAGTHAYVINEMLCTVTAFAYDPDRGSLKSFQTVSTLPSGEQVRPSYSTAEIEVHPSGKFVYGSNRGHNTIAVFTVEPQSGKLTLIQNEPTRGKTPRGFGIDPSGKFLIAGNQDSDSVLVFKIDEKTGRLSAAGDPVAVGAPVCVKFLAR